jgi:hypothetical protein
MQNQRVHLPHMVSSRCLGILLILLHLALMGCSKSPTETLLRETIDGMQAAGEARKLDGVIEHVSPRFSGQDNSLTKDDLKRYLLGVIMRTQSLGVTRTSTKIELKGELAIVTLGLLVTDGSGLLPSNGQHLNARTIWRFEENRWQMLEANWE